ncbi:TIGR04283 family arsenosugar biosynthesis glycosyltransferase [Hyunsoonleella ulvae]|uniref:TIGR04283 family arsenosugar biosynthesis glycosyltransferase n=1 Tax=Hyunsoonleella ulvae TaxID=2799948 RepID=UPI001939300B|nr:TIGR04283 family arsenosugar biosynthesis glycosyltransferase [Hyunsoonleella ulvae]
MNKISIIIPVLNEGAHIKTLLHHLVQNASDTHIEDIIIVDGGSIDNTEKVVIDTLPLFKKLQTNIKLVTSEKGRAKQMNRGAKAAKSNILYFLHADSFPPKNFDKYIIAEVTKGNKAGCFRMRFDSNHWWLKLAGWLTALPIKASRGGDQSQFITQQLFNEIGGYDERYTIYEDNDLIKKLYARHQYVVIPKWLTTSARCYEKHGVWRTQFHFWRIHLKSRLGASPNELKSYYTQYLAKT